MLSTLLTLALATTPVLEEKTIEALAAELAAGKVTSEQLTRASLARIEAMDRKGPSLHAVIAVNPSAIADAKALDAERKRGTVRGPLHGIPLLIKDNIETRDELPTTAGSLALEKNLTHRDAPVVAKLRAAGAIIVGKANLSEWANIRSSSSSSGWSALGGQTRNPYELSRNPSGSSSGSAVAVAASYVPAALGSETDGSVTAPASVCGVVGFKPSVGLLSRTFVIPISHSQDTVGPLTHSVRDAALLFDLMRGPDEADPSTRGAAGPPVLPTLTTGALQGVRLGVLRQDLRHALASRFSAALAALQKAGATLVDIDLPATQSAGDAELVVLRAELRQDLDAYLATTPKSVPVRSLDDVIAFNRAHADVELRWFGQDFFEASARTDAGTEYVEARATSLRASGDVLAALMKTHRVAGFVAPTFGPATRTDLVNGDPFYGPYAPQLPAIPGWPHLSVPMGDVEGLPVGLSFFAPRNSDAEVLGWGYAFEQATHAHRPPKYLP